MLIGRAFFLLTTSFIVSQLPYNVFIVTFFILIVLTELLPFSYLVYSMTLRLKAFKRTRSYYKSVRSSSRDTQST